MSESTLTVTEKIRQSLSFQDEQHVALFENTNIKSVFQPIYSLLHSRMVGVEGLMRCTSATGQTISPLEMLNSRKRSMEESIFLDRLCRYLHIGNMLEHVPDAHWIFLNVSAQTVIEGRKSGGYFADLLSEFDFPAHRVVIEILEDSVADEKILAQAVNYYRDLGCIIAIDDFGAGHSNFNRIFDIAPEIVKLDRSLTVRAVTDKQTSRTLPKLVELLHESGCLVLMEGIETGEEAAVAVKAGIDMAQGFYFAKPTLKAQPVKPTAELIAHIRERHIQTTRQASVELALALKPYIEQFQYAANKVQQGVEFAPAVSRLAEQPLVTRCYLLNQAGRCNSPTGSMLSTQPTHHDQRFAILSDDRGADWSLRSYFRKAHQSPGQVHVSEPYMSIADARMCRTLSIAIADPDSTQVLCCDIESHF